MSFDNGKRYWVYGTGKWLCLKPNKVTQPEYMAILHVIKPVHTSTWYILVHNGMYNYCFFVPVHTSTYLYRDTLVCTKNPDFILLVGISDVQY